MIRKILFAIQTLPPPFFPLGLNFEISLQHKINTLSKFLIHINIFNQIHLSISHDQQPKKFLLFVGHDRVKDFILFE